MTPEQLDALMIYIREVATREAAVAPFSSMTLGTAKAVAAAEHRLRELFLKPTEPPTTEPTQ